MKSDGKKVFVGKVHKIKSAIVVFLLLFPLCLVLHKLVYLQILTSSSLSKRGNSQHKINLKLEPRRGYIYDRQNRILAGSVEVFSIYAVPYEIKEPSLSAKQLSDILNVSFETLEKRLKSSKKFVWIKRKITDAQYNQIKELNIEGLGFLNESKRFYPKDELLSHVLGFVNLDNKGLEGLELSLDTYLRGEYGLRIVERDAAGRTMMSMVDQDIPPKNGQNIVLTIDEVIQHIAEEELDKAYKKYNAQAASIIVMDPYSGEILALANRPTYNPNEFSNSALIDRRNRAVTDFFEPGSTFKALVGAAALNENIVKLQDTFFCENGSYRIGKRTLHDSHPYANLTFNDVIAKSSNIGIAKVADILGKDKLYGYIKDFGFGDLTNVGLKGEVSGMVHRPGSWSRIQMANIAMGQGVAVTAVQLVNAVSAIANGGNLMSPRIVKCILAEDGELVLENTPQVVKQVISRQAAGNITTALQAVVAEKGTARRAAMTGFSVAGKTGTAQKIKETGGYSHSDFIASFVGFVPANDPKLVMLVVLDAPKPIYYGGVVAAPVFKEVAKGVLKYLGVAPQVEEEKIVKKETLV